MEHLKRLLPYINRYKVPFCVGMIGLLIARVFEAMIPLFLRDGIDSLATGKPSLAIPALAIVGCVVARFLSIISSRRLIRRIGVSVAYDLRKRAYAHVQKQGAGFFTKHGTGDLMARAINDIQLIRQLIGQGTRSVVVLLFCAALGLFFMIRLSPSLTLLILPPLPVISLVAYLFSKRVFTLSMAVQEGFAELSDHTQENLNGIRTVQALAQEDEEIRRFNSVNAKYADNYLALIRTNSLLGSCMPALGAICQVVILGFGGSRVLSGEISIGTFAAFFWYLNMVLWPVRDAGNMITLFQRGASGTQRLFEILDSQPEIVDQPIKDVPDCLSGELELRHLSYRYPFAERPALQDISFKVEAGETIAILGRVGSGKSTLLKLFVRLLDPPPNTLFLDGHDIRSYPLVQVRNQVALVLQDPFLFAETLRINLTYDDPERPIDEVWSAAEAADMVETILDFPDQMETLIGERGVTLSGGQKQRSTMARGLIRRSQVLIMDDCFSSIDTETEGHILTRLKMIRRDRTTLLVSHRVSTVRHADRIFMLDNGRIAEMGTHEALIAQGGLYATLAAVQNKRSKLLEILDNRAVQREALT